MDIHQITYREKLAEHLIQRFTKRRLEASFAATAAQAREEVLAMIPDGATVSRGGSVSVVEAGLWEALVNRPGVEVIDPFVPGLAPEVAHDRRRQSLLVDFFITGTNAITLDGKLVNLDGLGNRVAGLCFGPKKVIVVVGLNKVAPDLETAMARVKHHAAPINAIRLKRATPCVETGLCTDCRSPERICYMWSIIEGHMLENRIHVKLVGEDLGY
jgi:L-lactate utilization protein LutB